MSSRKRAEAILQQVPNPDTIRAWLATAIREAALLRSLLRVAQRKASYRPPRRAAAGAPARVARGEGAGGSAPGARGVAQ